MCGNKKWQERSSRDIFTTITGTKGGSIDMTNAKVQAETIELPAFFPTDFPATGSLNASPSSGDTLNPQDYGTITLKNGEVAILTPSNNSMGLYCNSGRYITINYTLSRSAFHRSRVRAYVAGPSSEFVREITASGLRSGFTTQATDYYYGMVTNLSSDAFTIKSFSITF